jgi:hypothetical protein
MTDHDQLDKATICQWCQSEIVWDPEIGPESECPHCFNELGDYRSVTFGAGIELDEEDEEVEFTKLADEGVIADSDASSMQSDILEDEEEWPIDQYGMIVQKMTDMQIEAPECSSCREFMLHVGDQRVKPKRFEPAVTEVLKRPALPAPFKLNIYVCPSCFRVETLLADEDRVKMIENLNQS